MRKRVWVVLAACFGLLVATGPLFAHHGTGMFDYQRSVNVKGTITQFDFVNPHVGIRFESKDDKGNVERWIAEAGSPNMMHRNGWNKASLKPGDQVTVTGHPARDGSKSMRLEKIVFPDGRQLLPDPPLD